MASASSPIGHNLTSNSNQLKATRTRYLTLLSHIYAMLLLELLSSLSQCRQHVISVLLEIEAPEWSRTRDRVLFRGSHGCIIGCIVHGVSPRIRCHPTSHSHATHLACKEASSNGTYKHRGPWAGYLVPHSFLSGCCAYKVSELS